MPLPKIPTKPATILLARITPSRTRQIACTRSREGGERSCRRPDQRQRRRRTQGHARAQVQGRAAVRSTVARSDAAGRAGRRLPLQSRRPPPSPSRPRRQARTDQRQAARERHERTASGQAQAGRGQRQVLGQPQGRQRRHHQDVRARHQRADARPDLAVPLRGTRRLPADDDAGRARQPQEGHVGSRAQRTPGLAHARRPDRRTPTTTRSRPASRWPSWATRMPRAACTSRPAAERRRPAGRPAGRARPTTRSWAWCAPSKATSRAAPSCWCRRTSTCASRRARWACRPRTTSTTTCWKTPTCCTRASCSCRTTSGPSTARTWSLAGNQERLLVDLLPRHRPAGAFAAGQPVRVHGTEQRRSARSTARSSRSTARPPCCRPCATTATTRTTSGASPRATASRTSR
jgi:hypothetical protein